MQLKELEGKTIKLIDWTSSYEDEVVITFIDGSSAIFTSSVPICGEDPKLIVSLDGIRLE